MGCLYKKTFFLPPTAGGVAPVLTPATPPSSSKSTMFPVLFIKPFYVNRACLLNQFMCTSRKNAHTHMPPVVRATAALPFLPSSVFYPPTREHRHAKAAPQPSILCPDIGYSILYLHLDTSIYLHSYIYKIHT